MRRRRTFVVAYDIADPRRLVQVHRFLQERAYPVQYSVFLGTFSEPDLNALLEGLAKIIHPRKDDVRVYPLPTTPDIESLGRPVLPDGVIPGDGSVVGLGRWFIDFGDREDGDGDDNDDGDDDDWVAKEDDDAEDDDNA